MVAFSEAPTQDIQPILSSPVTREHAKGTSFPINPSATPPVTPSPHSTTPPFTRRSHTPITFTTLAAINGVENNGAGFVMFSSPQGHFHGFLVLAKCVAPLEAAYAKGGDFWSGCFLKGKKCRRSLHAC